ncbi:uncharacterized protein LOC144364529 [Saccoglossus kowalevskii]
MSGGNSQLESGTSAIFVTPTAITVKHTRAEKTTHEDRSLPFTSQSLEHTSSEIGLKITLTDQKTAMESSRGAVRNNTFVTTDGGFERNIITTVTKKEIGHSDVTHFDFTKQQYTATTSSNTTDQDSTRTIDARDDERYNVDRKIGNYAIIGATIGSIAMAGVICFVVTSIGFKLWMRTRSRKRYISSEQVEFVGRPMFDSRESTTKKSNSADHHTLSRPETDATLVQDMETGTSSFMTEDKVIIPDNVPSIIVTDESNSMSTALTSTGLTTSL